LASTSSHCTDNTSVYTGPFCEFNSPQYNPTNWGEDPLAYVYHNTEWELNVNSKQAHLD